MTNTKGMEIRFIICNPYSDYINPDFKVKEQKENKQKMIAAIESMEEYIRKVNWEYENEWFSKSGDKVITAEFDRFSNDEHIEMSLWVSCTSNFIKMTQQDFWEVISGNMKLA